MAFDTLQNLIDKQDNFEIVRDQIAFILLTEIANQQALATAGGKDADLWKLDVYTEASNPFEKWLNIEDADTDPDLEPWPIVNIWVNNMSYDESASNIVSRQKGEVSYFIDVYGLGISADDGGTGHIPGDQEAALEAQRGARLIRNILMSGQNVKLQLASDIVWQRWTESITIFQPEIEGRQMQHIVGARFAFRVGLNETSQEYLGEDLELVSVEIKRAEDGKVILTADYPST